MYTLPRPRRRSAALALVLTASVIVACGTGSQASEPHTPTPEEAHDEKPPTSEGGTKAEPHDGPLNRLAAESSPYLLLHKANPVDWYPWGEEALARAKAENKPIFLSVGYSTCYWCHVMERESFMDPEMAALINRWFIPIKVDREERPDLDEIYMTATQLMTRRGGWPNSVFLTPDLVPFFAGTYFPPEDRGGRPGFRTLLNAINDAWTNRRDDVQREAARLGDAMRRMLEDQQAPAATLPNESLVTASIADLNQRFDAEWGGFGSAPKFPSPSNLLLLLAVENSGAESGERARTMLGTTLDRMARGGMYDQAGGGFHRYSTDHKWLVPHFEKMLYDNGLLLEVYARWFAVTNDPQAARIVRETATFLANEMTSPEGALWSAIDAETNAREGAYYVWTQAELNQALGEDAAFLAPIFGFNGEANFEGHEYVLHLPKTLAEIAKVQGITHDALLARLAPLRARLVRRRTTRERPLTDDKVLTDWNGMAIAGLATAGRLLNEPSMVEAAARAARFVLTNLRPKDQPLQHTWRGGKAKIDAYLDDYAFLLRGLLALEDATGARTWRSEALTLADEMVARLSDKERGGFYASVERDDLLARTKPLSDGAVPGGNAIALLVLQDLAERTGDPRWHQEVERSLRAFAPAATRSPAAYRTFALAVHRAQGIETGPTAPTASKGAEPSVADMLAAQTDDLVHTEMALGGQPTDVWRPVTVTIRVAEGWHVNANPASDTYLVPTKLEPTDGTELRNPRYPAGHELDLAFTAEPISVYDDEFTLAVETRPKRGRPDGEGMAIVLTFQACDDRRCLPPVRRTLTVP